MKRKDRKFFHTTPDMITSDINVWQDLEGLYCKSGSIFLKTRSCQLVWYHNSKCNGKADQSVLSCFYLTIENEFLPRNDTFSDSLAFQNWTALQIVTSMAAEQDLRTNQYHLEKSSWGYYGMLEIFYPGRKSRDAGLVYAKVFYLYWIDSLLDGKLMEILKQISISKTLRN